MTNIVIFPGEENTLLIIGFVHSHVHCGTVDHILKREQDALESQSERLLDTEMSNVLDLFTKSQLTGHEGTEQNQLPAGAHKITYQYNDGAEE